MPSKKKKSVVALMKKARNSPAYYHQRLLLILDRLEKVNLEAIDARVKLSKARRAYIEVEEWEMVLTTHLSCAAYHIVHAQIAANRWKGA